MFMYTVYQLEYLAVYWTNRAIEDPTIMYLEYGIIIQLFHGYAGNGQIIFPR